MSKKPRKARYIATILGVLLLLLPTAGYLVLKHVAPYAIIKPELRHYLGAIEEAQAARPADLGLHADRLAVTVADSITLQGWYIYAGGQISRGTIALLHGIASGKESLLPAAAALTEAGFNCIVYDARAHGTAANAYCTFGYYEKHDLMTVLDSVETQFADIGPFGIYGASYGGAVALQALAEDSRLRCGIVESAFASLPDVIFDYQRRLTGIPWRFVSDQALRQAGNIAHFDPQQVVPARSARAIRQPVLLIHGNEDIHIPIAHGQTIYRNLASADKCWYPVRAADHTNVWAQGGAPLRERWLGFFLRHLSATAVEQAPKR